jgi:outer membrane lipoprotein-sorting protein
VSRIRPSAVPLLVVLLLGLLAGSASALTAEEMIDRYYDAIGGVEKYTSLQTMTVTGKVQVMGMELPFTMSTKRPNKLHIASEFQGAKIVQLFDGEHGWMINPMMGTTEPQPMPEIQEKGFKVQADMDGPLIDWQKKGYTLEVLPDDEVEGTPVHRLRVGAGEGITITMCFDQDSFLLIKQTTKLKQDDAEFEQDTFMSDYRDIEGRLVPMAWEQRMGGDVQSNMVMESVVFDAPVDDALFTAPAAATPPAAEK